LAISDDKAKHIYKNQANVNVNDNDSCKQIVYFELTQNKQQVITELTQCHYRTPPVEVAVLLTELFKEWPSYQGHWLHITQKYNPRAINRIIKQLLKLHSSGQETIKNPAAYFTSSIKWRKPRRTPKSMNINGGCKQLKTKICLEV